MNDLLSSGRYLVKTAKGEGDPTKPTLQDVLDECPPGFSLHSITPWASGSGYAERFIVVFERDPTRVSDQQQPSPDKRRK